MALYLVTSEHSEPALGPAVAAIAGSHLWSERIAFMPYVGTAQALTKALVETHGLARSGLLVIQVNADYYGYSSKPKWDWLAAAFREQPSG